MEHECAPPRSAETGELPPADTLWRCGCGRVWEVRYATTLDADGNPAHALKTWAPSSRLRYLRRYGLRG